MKTLNNWFDEYAISHQNETNKKIHYICVPIIFFSVVGLLFCIPNEPLSFLNSIHPIIGNWAFIAMLFVLVFYFRLSFKMGVQMFLFTAFCLLVNYLIAQKVNLFYFTIIVFAVGWLGQFYGHKVEGKKPSFLKDLQFLLIGPAWVIHSLCNGK